MKMRPLLTGMAAAVVMCVAAQLAVAADVSNAKCPVSGKACDESQSVAFDGGKVYFCCDKCPAEFEKNKAKYAAKAALQLVVTGQAKQEKCPISGKPIDASQTVEVDGVKVAFCCKNCVAKVNKANEADQLKMCFGSAAFKKAYKVTQ
ncbi:MAG: hypothetical protein K8T25_06655 [Planctomycetia bacterium]|nr:hypothetical protein [Planctomycetia bacterium]